MKGRERRRTPSADLLVCFPSRAHLTFIPKPIYSPARPSEPSSSRRHRHHLKKTSTRRARTGGGGGGQGSPLLWAKGNPLGGGQEIAEPTSPKVTCAGQIKVRHRSSSACRNWRSVMEEIDGVRSKRKQRKSPSWTEALGFKKDILQFLTCLRTIRLDFRCFGSFPGAEMSSDEEEEDEEEEDGGEIYHENQVGIEESEDNEGCSTVFSKWFMVLDEDQKDDWKLEERERKSKCDGESEHESSVPPPPPNALLLMRCRSAPVQSWFEEREKEGCEKVEEEGENENEYLKKVEEEKRKKKRESLAIVMRYDTDFHKLPSGIAKETWAVSGLKDQLPRSRSWKGW